MLRRAALRWGQLQLRQALQQQHQHQHLGAGLVGAAEGAAVPCSSSGSAASWSPRLQRALFSRAADGGAGAGAGAAGEASHAPRSMLDATLPHAGAAGSALGSAAAARLRSLQEAPDGAAAPAGPSLLRRALGWLLDAAIVAGLGAAVAGGWAYYRFTIEEVEAALEAARREELPSLASRARAAAIEAYLGVAVPLDHKVREYTDPTCDALLPELAPELRGRVKTLVLDLEGLLVHKEWSRAKGWQVLKRPGVEAFLLEMGRRYEVVIYTDEPAMYADPVINKVDPHRAVTYRLYRQDTQYKDGKHVRDLSKLNRDLSQVLFISADPDAWAFQPGNALKLKRWDRSSQDTTLLDLIPLLQMVQEVHVQDVRDVVRSYDGEEDVAGAFKARMAQLAQHKKPGGGGGGGRFWRGG